MKPVVWIGSSHEDLKEFPLPVQSAVGYALYFAQKGQKHERTKVLSNMGNASVLEIRENDTSGTYRVVYTVEMKECVFVLHAFQKKSKSGIATPKQDLDLIKSRLKEAKLLHRSLKEEEK